MEIKTVKINELKPHPKNPRVHPDSAIDKLVRSIKEFGWTNPVLVSADGYVLAGHARLKAAEKAGISEVPVVYLPLEGAKAEAYLIADNRLQDETDWDYAKLKDLLEELDTGEFDLELTGFGMDEIEDLIAQLHVPEEIIEDEVPEPPEEPKAKPGDIYQMGKHRLMCGDSTKLEDVKKLMGGELADMVFTDPPYNVDYTGGTNEALKIKNDNMDDSTFYNFLHDAFGCMLEVTKPGGGIYICHADSEGINFRSAMVNAGWLLKQCIIWVKNSLVMGRQDYHWQHEPILYGWKPGAAHKFYGGRKQSTVWQIDRPMASREHPTMKPVNLCAKAIENSSKSGDIIIDFFGGSGSTLIATEQLNRTCYMMEIDPVYCDVIVQRYINLKGHDGDVYLERDGNKIGRN